MNRKHRRALARIAHRHADGPMKPSYRLAPQRCLLWVPEACGYVESFSQAGFRVVEEPARAQIYVEDDATSAALRFHEITGLRVAIRPAYRSTEGLREAE